MVEAILLVIHVLTKMTVKACEVCKYRDGTMIIGINTVRCTITRSRLSSILEGEDPAAIVLLFLRPLTNTLRHPTCHCHGIH